MHTPSGQVLLFETYMPLRSVAVRTSTIWLKFLPITVGGAVLLQLVEFPLAARLARQTGRARRDREQMLHRSLEASDAERRRIAANLHDGVVQDLAATSIALAGAAVAPSATGTATSPTGCTSPRDAVRAGIRSLRSLVVDIHPPNLRRTGTAGRARRPRRSDHGPRRGYDARGRRRRGVRPRRSGRAVRVPRGPGGAAQRGHARRGERGRGALRAPR